MLMIWAWHIPFLSLLDNLCLLEPKMITGKWIDAYKKGIEEMKHGFKRDDRSSCC
jgi:hypothetical protein